MDKVNKINNVSAALRSNISSHKKSAENKVTTNKSGPQEALTNVETKSTKALKAVLTKRLRAVDEKSISYAEQLEQVYIGSTLSHEFGENIVNDIAFSEMIEDIREQIDSKQELKAKLESAIKTLLSN